LVERGPLRELLNLSFKPAHVRLVLVHQRLELTDVLFFRLVDVASALCGLLAHVARLLDSQQELKDERSPRVARTHIKRL